MYTSYSYIFAVSYFIWITNTPTQIWTHRGISLKLGHIERSREEAVK